ncbi:MAG: glycine betaine ABC transporter substrate-binding protein [Actinomycetota bacterium]
MIGSEGRTGQAWRTVARAAALMAVVVLTLAACSGQDAADGDGSGNAVAETDADGLGTETTESASSRDVRRPTIQLGVTDWTGARLNAVIAERLIERRLGYPVETVQITDLLDMAVDLERGDIDAVLEVWPNTLLPTEQEAIESSSIVDLGPLGVEGRVGWYVPRYVAEGELGVTGWEDLADSTVASAFATPQTGRLGRFLGTNPDYAQYDEGLVDALDLPFEVIYSGSDAATEDAVAAAVAAEEAVLLYWWRPTALVDRYDLVEVPLPPRTEECVADIEAEAAFACAYPVDELTKLASPELSARAPEVEQFLRAFRLTTDQQEAMIGRVDNDGVPLLEVADTWIAANEAIWETWFE